MPKFVVTVYYSFNNWTIDICKFLRLLVTGWSYKELSQSNYVCYFEPDMLNFGYSSIICYHY